MIVRVLDNQSLFDIAMMHCGKAELAYDIAIANGISVTDSVNVGFLGQPPFRTSKWLGLHRDRERVV